MGPCWFVFAMLVASFFFFGMVYEEMKRVCVDVLVHEVDDLLCSYGVLLVAGGL